MTTTTETRPTPHPRAPRPLWLADPLALALTLGALATRKDRPGAREALRASPASEAADPALSIAPANTCHEPPPAPRPRRPEQESCFEP